MNLDLGCPVFGWSLYSKSKNNLTDCIDDQFELLVLVLVVVLCILVQDGNVDAAQDDLQVQAGRPGKSVLNLVGK